jgi:hypothetical protein
LCGRFDWDLPRKCLFLSRNIEERNGPGQTHAWRKAHAWGIPAGPYQLLRLAQMVLPWNGQTAPVFDDLNFGEVAVSEDGRWLRMAAIDASNEVVLAHTVPIEVFNASAGTYRPTSTAADAPLCVPWQGPNSLVQSAIGLLFIALAACSPLALGAWGGMLVSRWLAGRQPSVAPPSVEIAAAAYSSSE